MTKQTKMDQLLDDISQIDEAKLRTRAVLERMAKFFPDAPEGDLWFAVFGAAVADASEFEPKKLNPFRVLDARWYLAQPIIPACDICDINSDFARRVIAQAGITYMGSGRDG